LDKRWTIVRCRSPADRARSSALRLSAPTSRPRTAWSTWSTPSSCRPRRRLAT